MSDTENPSCRRFLVTGRVQGVFFRASTCDIARNLSLTGYAKNLPDGSVEIIACGPSEAIDELAAWLQEGPRMASVAGVNAEAIEIQKFDGFGTG